MRKKSNGTRNSAKGSAMEQIATGGEAAAASQQTLAAANNTATTLARARDRAMAARGRTDAGNNIKTNGERQASSVTVMEKLSEQAASIGEVPRRSATSRIRPICWH